VISFVPVILDMSRAHLLPLPAKLPVLPPALSPAQDQEPGPQPAAIQVVASSKPKHSLLEMIGRSSGPAKALLSLAHRLMEYSEFISILQERRYHQVFL